MPRFVGAATGLLVFAGMILRGCLAGNSVETILGRALVGLFAGVVLGTFVGWAARKALEETVCGNRTPGAGSDQPSATAQAEATS